MGRKLLVDGYILNNNPADVVKRMGAKHVTAIRVLSSNQQKQAPTSFISCLNRYIDTASCMHTEQLLKSYADIIIDVDLLDIGRFAPKSLSAMIQQGQSEARKILAREKDRAAFRRMINMEPLLQEI
jgi:NTE family protein